MSLSCLVVLYRKKLSDCSTLNSIIGFDSYGVLSSLTVWDNSPSPQNPDEINKFKLLFSEIGIEFNYTNHPENTPLSKIYNLFLDREKFKSKYILILDDDSKLDSTFLSKLSFALNSSVNYDLVLPIVKYKNRIISPSKRILMKGAFYKNINPGPISSRYLSAINSGMTISTEYLIKSGFKYDERLTSYGTDDQFITSFSKNKGKAFIIDYNLEHDLTLSMLNKNSNILQERYLEMTSSWLIVFGKNRLSRFFIRIYMAAHSFSTSIRFNDFSYFICTLKKLFK
ncbi:MAG: hypothetical protein ACJASR_001146 [Psychroserpens sp.]|jgi:hypothetical protein